MSFAARSAFTIAGIEIIAAELFAPKSVGPRQAAHRALRYRPRDKDFGRTTGSHAGKPQHCHIEETAMTWHPTDFQGSVIDAPHESIEQQIHNSRAAVSGGGGYFSIYVAAPAFTSRSMLDRPRLVDGASAQLMQDDMSLLHTFESLKARKPACFELGFVDSDWLRLISITEHSIQLDLVETES
jgi:stress-induced morphogen